ncbi:hypothetical protein [Embleya hyalina]|uniref:hypothetical protein n=1 Tax=Embleya hyalina TaxID=516124 RepID=UPI000F83FB7C|nr:hypothetical protein [Embleya hyalina]
MVTNPVRLQREPLEPGIYVTPVQLPDTDVWIVPQADIRPELAAALGTAITDAIRTAVIEAVNELRNGATKQD